MKNYNLCRYIWGHRPPIQISKSEFLTSEFLKREAEGFGLFDVLANVVEVDVTIGGVP